MLKEKLLDYLRAEKVIAEEELKNLEMFTRDQLIEKGLLIPNSKVLLQIGNEIDFITEINNSKFTPGDKVTVTCHKFQVEATILENSISEVSVLLSRPISFDHSLEFDITYKGFHLIEPLISVYEKMASGFPGWSILSILEGEATPRLSNRFSSIDPELKDKRIQKLGIKVNESQNQIINRAVELPSLYAVQGPPGTGKSFSLAVLSDIFFHAGKRILILGHTHQSVNNCLLAIRKLNSEIPLVKVGENLKSEGLPNEIRKVNFSEFNKELGVGGKTYQNSILGMTYYSAVFHLGLRRNRFNPNVIFVDEAGQLPLSIGAMLGVFGAGCNILFGDDKQMPPIFKSELQEDELSCSVFSQFRKKHPDFISMLNETYRMNQELTEFIGKNFYADEMGESRLFASESSKGLQLSIENIGSAPEWMRPILAPRPSLNFILSNQPNCTQLNENEAIKIVEILLFVLQNGLKASQIAVVAPFRKQIIEIRRRLIAAEISELPIVDTVERVQGITVDMVIVSFTSTDDNYLSYVRNFVFSPNRINVAISRARKKAIIFAPSIQIFGK